MALPGFLGSMRGVLSTALVSAVVMAVIRAATGNPGSTPRLATYTVRVTFISADSPVVKVLVRVAGAVKKVGTLTPDQLGDYYEDFFETGGKAKAAKVFASTETSKGSVGVYEEGPDDDPEAYATEKYFAKDPAHPVVYALKLADGRTLALFPTAHTSESMLKPQYTSSFDITPTEKEALYDPTERDVVTDEFQGQALAVPDPKGKPRVTAVEHRMADSR
ncbi:MULTISPECIES: hypothetical protein [Streptomyces]|uniref:hypothetical protein n=1 Tax=Streptomyces TaxID=1883 RepID=UPI0031D76536